MEPPRLKINEHEVGLRKIGDNLFAPKNESVLLETLLDRFTPVSKDWGYENPVPPISAHDNNYQSIKSFCFTTSINRILEAKILLRSLRLKHQQPIYIHCDTPSKAILERQGYKDLIIKDVINEKYLKDIVKRHTKHKYDILESIHHCRSDYIFAKLECLKQAMLLFKNTFFLDTDIIVLDKLQEKFNCDVCLSPAYFPPDKAHSCFEYGFYNAGYLFCANRGFPSYWIKQFLTDSVFYEQQCMDRIPEVYNTQTFGLEHNYGFWRLENPPTKAKSLHVHITQEVENEIKNDPAIEYQERFRTKSLDIIKASNPDLFFYIKRQTNFKKLAFIHMAKTDGRYVRQYLSKYVLPPCKCHTNASEFGRGMYLEYSKDEMLDICDMYNGNLTKNILMRSHQNTWSKDLVIAYRKAGWETFTFIRSPADIICSLYFFSKRKSKTNLTMHPSSGIAGHQRNDSWEFDKVDAHKISLDSFVREVVTNPALDIFWKLPDYIKYIGYCAVMSNKNFAKFIENRVDPYHNYVVDEKLTNETSSDNKGFDYYIKSGDITAETETLLKSHPEYKKYLNKL